MKIVCSIVAFAIATTLCITASAASGNAWHMTQASSAHASRTKSGIAISANVELANSCYEAKISVLPTFVPPAEYQVVTRVKPEDVGKICNMVVVPSVASGSFIIMKDVPQTVKVHATNKTFNVQVKDR